MSTAPNIDPREISLFKSQAGQWWQASGEFKALHQINPVRLAYVMRRAPLRGRRVIDVGCGGGLLAEAMAARGARVTGIDMTPEALQVARAHATANGLGIDYRLGTAETWARKEPGAFDVLTCMELVEHVPDPASLIRACAALVRPGGDVFFSTVNRTWLARALVIVASEYLLRIVRPGTHQYRRFVRPRELAAYARRAGLRVAHISGLRFLPFIGYVRLCRDTRMNYLLHAQKPD
jgi:2-polyprenyl-6-hydroxyphenyl methylase/3-demethylubiquinone-9 3-methyltransferase